VVPVFEVVVDIVSVPGGPVCAAKMLSACQPPTTALSAPPALLRKRRPWPTGRSYTPLKVTRCEKLNDDRPYSARTSCWFCTLFRDSADAEFPPPPMSRLLLHVYPALNIRPLARRFSADSCSAW